MAGQSWCRAAVWVVSILSVGGIVLLPSASAGAAGFHRLQAEQVRQHIIGRDITDDFYWTEYYRRDGVLVVSGMGSPQNGRWKIERDMLCLVRETHAAFACF